MDPVITGSLIGAGASLFGGKKSRDAQRELNQQNIDYQNIMATEGIRLRVEDAKAAGVHPLYALGAQSPQFAPVGPAASYDDYGDAGRHLGNAVAASQTVEQRAMQKAQLEAIQAGTMKDYSEAAYWDSQAAITRQREGVTSPFPELAVDQDTYHKVYGEFHGERDKTQVFNPYSDAIVRRYDFRGDPEPVSLMEKSAGLDNPSGRGQPLWSRFDSGQGDIVLPYTPAGQGVMEALEGLDVKYLPAVIAENRRRFGDAGVKRLMKLYDPGKVDYGRSDAQQRKGREGYGYRGKGAPSHLYRR